MKELIQAVVRNTQTLREVQQELVRLFEQVRNENQLTRIGYVAGIITSDGPEHVDANIRRLSLFTEKIREQEGFPIFSATDVFINGLFDRLPEMALPRQDRETAFIGFWRDVLKSGYVTDIFLTPRWDESKGARDEHKTAVGSKIAVHFVDIHST